MMFCGELQKSYDDREKNDTSLKFLDKEKSVNASPTAESFHFFPLSQGERYSLSLSRTCCMKNVESKFETFLLLVRFKIRFFVKTIATSFNRFVDCID